MKFGLRDVSKSPEAESELAASGASLGSVEPELSPLAVATRSARQRLWAADVACYYAQRRFSQTGRAADRLIWESCQQETQKALAAVREAERAWAK